MKRFFKFVDRFKKVDSVIDTQLGIQGFDEYLSSRTVSSKKPACLAPWVSMTFNIDGTVSVCCLNKKTSASIINSSIEQVWNSPAFVELRTSVEHGNLSHDCQTCLYQINTGNYTGVKARDYDKFHPVSDFGPKVMEFCLDNTCNLACKMCNSVLSSTIRKERGLTPLRKLYGDDFVKDLEQYIPYLEEAVFAGGEPFLIPIYYSIWEKIIEVNPNVTISVVTNCTTLNDKVKSILARGKFRINTSIDAVEREIYESIRQHADFNQVMENFEWFRAYTESNGFILNIPVCPLTTNWKNIPDLIRFANMRNVTVNFVSVERPMSLALSQQSLAYLTDVIDFLCGQHFEENSKTSSLNIKRYNGLIQDIDGWRSKKRDEIPSDEDFQLAFGVWETKVNQSDNLDSNQKKEVISSIRSVIPTIPENNRYRFITTLNEFSVDRIYPVVSGRSTKEISVVFRDFFGE